MGRDLYLAAVLLLPLLAGCLGGGEHPVDSQASEIPTGIEWEVANVSVPAFPNGGSVEIPLTVEVRPEVSPNETGLVTNISLDEHPRDVVFLNLVNQTGHLAYSNVMANDNASLGGVPYNPDAGVFDASFTPRPTTGGLLNGSGTYMFVYGYEGPAHTLNFSVANATVTDIGPVDAVAGERYWVSNDAKAADEPGEVGTRDGPALYADTGRIDGPAFGISVAYQVGPASTTLHLTGPQDWNKTLFTDPNRADAVAYLFELGAGGWGAGLESTRGFGTASFHLLQVPGGFLAETTIDEVVSFSRPIVNQTAPTGDGFAPKPS